MSEFDDYQTVPVAENMRKRPLSFGVLDAIDAWREKRREDIHRKVAARSARESRERYRAEREAEGKTVRPYTFHSHLPRQHDETENDFRKRIHRDRQRIYKVGSEHPRRPRADLSKMTEEERADHNQKLANASKQRERDKKKYSNLGAATETQSSVGSGIEWGMF